MISRFDTLYRSAARQKIQLCEHDGCNEVAKYNAPVTKHLPESFELSARADYAVEGETLAKELLFCLQHVREYNAHWDFFEGMSGDEIDAFRLDAMMGHRKPRATITSANEEQLYAEAMKMRGGGGYVPRKPSVPENQRDALITLGLSYPLTKQSLKAKYRELVKKYHPDRAGKAAEEKFKQVSRAYDLLKNHVEA